MRQCVNCVKDGVEIKVVQTFQLRDQRQKDVATSYWPWITVWILSGCMVTKWLSYNLYMCMYTLLHLRSWGNHRSINPAMITYNIFPCPWRWYLHDIAQIAISVVPFACWSQCFWMSCWWLSILDRCYWQASWLGKGWMIEIDVQSNAKGQGREYRH